MYYEEKTENGQVYYRTSPDGEWTWKGMTSPDKTLRDCVHGNLARSCYLCELNAANARVKELEAKLATARDDVLEEAARLCDVQACARWTGISNEAQARIAEAELCAQIIRSLKSSSDGP